MYYDLHIHSALSPCGDNTMTINNIFNMAYIKGIELIAICDHNSLKQQFYLDKIIESPVLKGKIDYIHGVELQSKEEIHVLDEVIKSIMDADLIIISIGSLYTSILPHLICKDVVKALNETNAKVMYICNAMTQPGETDNFGVSDHVNTIEKYIGKNTIDVVIASNTKIDEEMLKKYETEEQKDQVFIDYDKLKDVDYEVIIEDLLTTEEGTITHNSMKLSSVIFSYLNR